MHIASPLDPLPSNIPQPGDIMSSSLGDIVLRRCIGRGKSGYSYEAQLGERRVVFKKMHNEPCEFYSFETSKTRMEERDYFRLRAMGIRIPRLLCVNHEAEFLVKEYIPGPTAAEHIAGGLPDRGIIAQLFAIAACCEQAGRNIDYFPTNFVIAEGSLYYIDYESNDYDPRWNLQAWGIYFWANPAGMDSYLKTGSASLLHSEPEKGIPLKEPFETLVHEWIEEFGTRARQHEATAEILPVTL